MRRSSAPTGPWCRRRFSCPSDVTLSGLSGSYVYGSTYHVDGSPATSSYPAAGGLAAETVTTAYDATGRVTTVGGLSSYLSAISYAWDGRVTQQTLGSGTNRVRLTRVFDDATGRMFNQQVHTEHPGTPNTWDEVVAEQFRWFDAGNLKSIVEQHGGSVTSAQCFTYDYLQRLTEAWTNAVWNCGKAPAAVTDRGPDPYWTTWTLDKTGNRTSQVAHSTSGGADATTNYVYPAAGGTGPHRLSSTNGAAVGTYGYDAVGNTTTRNVGGTVRALTWDAEGLLSTHTVDGQTSSYLYDADGVRLIRRDPTGTTLYLPGQELRRASGGTVTATRYYPNAVRTTSGGLTWTAGDHHGTQQTAINATTLATSRRLTMPYGEPRGAQPSWPDERGYLGAPTDPTGLTHLGAREYDPGTGRFVSVDPLSDYANPQTLNGYAYAENSPTTLADPSGLSTIVLFDGGGSCADLGVARGRCSTKSDYHPDTGPNTRPDMTYHDWLDMCGTFADGPLAPVGMGCDGVNAGAYLAEGKYVDATVAAVGLIPGGSWVCKAGRVCKRLLDWAASRVFKGAAGVAGITAEVLEKIRLAARAEASAVDEALDLTRAGRNRVDAPAPTGKPHKPDKPAKPDTPEDGPGRTLIDGNVQ